MGPSKLWNILVPASESRSLLNLATLEGFENNNRGHRAFVVGVDASIRISAVIAALQAAGVYHPGVGGQTLVLEKLFYQLCNFSSAPLTLVFVFDGPGRPSMKRGINVVHRPLWLIDQLKTMITAFGYHFYDAPGEAEAELALLNADGRIDAIITEDSDAFVFGARVVIRTLGPSPQDIASIYSIDAIENTDTVLLDRDGLVLCALLLGGDYASGVLGIGQHIAHGLAAGGFGTELVNIFRVDSAERGKYLAGWRNKVREELRTNSSGRLGRRWPSLADNLLDTFPNPRVVDLYLNPLTSASPSYLGPMPANTWLPREPAIHDVSNLCRSLFRWNGEELLKKLSSCVWPSVAFRMLSSRFVVYSKITNLAASPTTRGHLLKITKASGSKAASMDLAALSLYRVRVSTQNFVALAGLGHLPAIAPSAIKLVSIPSAILAVALRDMSLPFTDLAHVPFEDSDSGSEMSVDSDGAEEDDAHSAIIVDVMDSDEEDFVNAHRALGLNGIIDLTD